MTVSLSPPARRDLDAAEYGRIQAALREKPVYVRVKRTVDIVLAAAALLALSPVMILIAVSIRLTSRGPILYRSTRDGYRGRPFAMLKFRSMFTASEAQENAFRERLRRSGTLPKSADDARVTPLGRRLRRTSLDELPQLINVLRGEMSLVGPRPILLDMVAPYPNFARARSLVRPGLGGLWQIRERANATHVSFMWDHDLEYIRTLSWPLDCRVMLLTALAAVRQTGAT